MAVFLPANAAAALQVPWTAYFGSHYGQAPWAQSIRDPGGPRVHGVSVRLREDEQTATARQSQRESSATTRGTGGQRRGEKRGARREGASRQTRQRERGSRREGDSRYARRALVGSLGDVLKSHSVVLNAGGIGSGRNSRETTAFVHAMLDNNGRNWRNALRTRVAEVAALGNPERVYWQFGNEINSRRFRQNISAATGRRESRDSHNVGPYAELYLAPGVEEIRAASAQVFGDEERINIVLGSLGAARNPRSLAWLNALLSYRLEGTHAPSLKGRRVHELVDIISIHYLVSAPDDEWRSTLDDLRRKWLGLGTVKGIWSTEEIGIRRAKAGAGAGVALQVWSRYLTWWMENDLTPAVGRCFLWGSSYGNADTRGDTAMQALFDFLGPVPLAPVASSKSGSGRIETRAFEAPGNGKRVIVAFVNDRDASGTVSELTLDARGWKGRLQGHGYHFSRSGKAEFEVEVATRGDSIEVTLGESVRLDTGAALLITFEPS